MRTLLGLVAGTVVATAFAGAPAAASGASTNWRQYPLDLPKKTQLVGIAAGADGHSMWFTNASNNTLSAIPVGGGSVKSYALMPVIGGVARQFRPAYLAAGADARLYMTGCVQIGRGCNYGYIVAAGSSGTLTAYATAGGGSGALSRLVLGPDKNVWFDDGGSIAKISPQGTVTDYPVQGGILYGDVAVGRDGNVWFDVEITNYPASFALDAINPRTGKIASFPVGGDGILCTGIAGLAAGSDGKMYANCIDSYPRLFGIYYLAGVAADGSHTAVPNVPGAVSLVRAPDGAIWFETLMAFQSPPIVPLLGRFDPVLGTITTYQAPFTLGFMNTLAVGPDGNIWAIDDGGTPAIDVYIRKAPARNDRRESAGAHAVRWTQYKSGVPHPRALGGIVAGPDGALWYTESRDGVLARMTTTGRTTLYRLTATISGKTRVFSPGFLTAGADDRFYLGGCIKMNATCVSGYVGAATTSGAFMVYKTPSGDGAGLTNRPALGPDGNVWIPESTHLARVATSGAITEYPYPQGATGVTYSASVGVGKDVWFDLPPFYVAKIVPSTGATTAYRLSSAFPCGNLSGIAAAGDGNVYLGCNPAASGDLGGLYEVTRSGSSMYFTGGWGGSSGTITGPDHHSWFFGSHLGSEEFGNGVIQEFSSAANSTTTYIPPNTMTPDFSAITTGPDGNIWAADRTGYIDVLSVR